MVEVIKQVYSYLKQISLYLLLSGIIVYFGLFYLNSALLKSLLSKDLINILLALLAIHITFVSLLLPKIQEIAEKKNIKLNDTISETKMSVNEQFVMLVVAGVGLMCLEAETLKEAFAKSPFLLFSINSILIFSLVYSFRILYDAFNALVILINELSNV